jgi:hypothetical protein
LAADNNGICNGWNSSTVSNGSHTMYAKAYDAGNFLKATSNTVTFNVQNTISNDGTTPAAVAPGWRRVLEDKFDGTTWPSHWSRYNSVYRGHPVSLQISNCANPRQAWLANGYMTMRMEWKDEICGSSSTSPRVVGWHSAGMSLKGYSANDQSVTLRWRVVQYPGVDANGNTAEVLSHRIIPMRWPDAGLNGDANARYYGEEDFCEGRTNASCRSFIHYGGKACPDCKLSGIRCGLSSATIKSGDILITYQPLYGPVTPPPAQLVIQQM